MMEAGAPIDLNRKMEGQGPGPDVEWEKQLNERRDAATELADFHEARAREQRAIERSCTAAITSLGERLAEEVERIKEPQQLIG